MLATYDAGLLRGIGDGFEGVADEHGGFLFVRQDDAEAGPFDF